MSPIAAEILGTAILVLLGTGVVANVVLNQTKGNSGGWIVITAGWGLAVYTAVLCTEQYSGAHLNPAVSIGLATAGEFAWKLVPSYVLAQMLGGFFGAVLVFFFYKSHYERTEDGDLKLATFCTSPNIRSLPLNLLSEIVGTFVLVYAVLMMADPMFTLDAESGSREIPVGLGSIGALRVGLVVFAIGLSLGGTTGYAINPARDLSPRLAHWLLPVPGKRDSDWSYSPIPVVGPIVGAMLAAALANLSSLGSLPLQ